MPSIPGYDFPGTILKYQIIRCIESPIRIYIQFKVIPIYETNDCTSIQIKEKKIINKVKPTLNKT